MNRTPDPEREERIRKAAEAKAELLRKGISISQWAVSNGFSTAMVFEILKGERKCVRGQSHKIAVALGIKEGDICNSPARALETRAAA
jgi:gp16 family phage-associated protein